MSGFDRLVAAAVDEPTTLGVILSGSRGRGAGRSDSDSDCYVIVDDQGLDDGVRSVRRIEYPLLDSTVLGLAQFDRYAAPERANSWEAYAFAHITISYDAMDGRIAEMAAAKELLDAGAAERIARAALDAFLNQEPFVSLEEAARSRGQGDVVDAWNERDLELLEHGEPVGAEECDR
jgi:hypothetical protein